VLLGRVATCAGTCYGLGKAPGLYASSRGIRLRPAGAGQLATRAVHPSAGLAARLAARLAVQLGPGSRAPLVGVAAAQLILRVQLLSLRGKLKMT
jgi:hypothetical protein